MLHRTDGSWKWRRPTAAEAIAVLALAVALGGTSMAAPVRKLFTGADIRDRSITERDLSRGAVASLRGRAGPAGPAGGAGPAGPTGLQGGTGPTGPAGPGGPPGARGLPGADGVDGVDGQDGVRGDTGLDGPRGDTGLGGPRGDTGLTGPRGDTGPNGPSGVIDTFYASGAGASPSNSTGLGWAFLGPSVQVTTTSTTQTILVHASKAFGSTATGGASNLRVAVCRRTLPGTSLFAAGSGIQGVRVLQNQRIVVTLDGRFTGLSVGDHLVGLCGFTATTGSENWNSNEAGSVTASLIQEQ